MGTKFQKLRVPTIPTFFIYHGGVSLFHPSSETEGSRDRRYEWRDLGVERTDEFGQNLEDLKGPLHPPSMFLNPLSKLLFIRGFLAFTTPNICFGT